MIIRATKKKKERVCVKVSEKICQFITVCMNCQSSWTFYGVYIMYLSGVKYDCSEQ